MAPRTPGAGKGARTQRTRKSIVPPVGAPVSDATGAAADGGAGAGDAGAVGGADAGAGDGGSFSEQDQQIFNRPAPDDSDMDFAASTGKGKKIVVSALVVAAVVGVIALYMNFVSPSATRSTDPDAAGVEAPQPQAQEAPAPPAQAANPSGEAFVLPENLSQLAPALKNLQERLSKAEQDYQDAVQAHQKGLQELDAARQATQKTAQEIIEAKANIQRLEEKQAATYEAQKQALERTQSLEARAEELKAAKTALEQFVGKLKDALDAASKGVVPETLEMPPLVPPSDVPGKQGALQRESDRAKMALLRQRMAPLQSRFAVQKHVLPQAARRC